jgi:uncharacterized protein (UPF0248 family)
MVYRVLSKLLWSGDLGRAGILIIHRGAPGDRKLIPGGLVIQVKRGHIVCRNQDAEEPDREVTIPLHRILEVRLDGRAVWKRAGKA